MTAVPAARLIQALAVICILSSVGAHGQVLAHSEELVSVWSSREGMLYDLHEWPPRVGPTEVYPDNNDMDLERRPESSEQVIVLHPKRILFCEPWMFSPDAGKIETPLEVVQGLLPAEQ